MESYAKHLGTLDIVIFSLKNQGFSAVSDGPLSLYPTNASSRLLYGWRALFSPPTSEKIDLVTAQDPFEVGLVGVFIAWRARVPLHVQIHTDLFSPAFARHSLLNRFRLLIARFVLRCATRIRVVSNRIKRDVEVRVPQATRKHIAVLPIFVDIEKYKTATAPRALIDHFASFSEKILVVSRLESEKNVAQAIASFADSGLKDACLIIVGDGSERAQLESLAAVRGVRERVFFEGRVDPASYYALADLVLVSSFYEGYGMTIIEALAAGVPVLSTDVGIAPEAGAQLAEYSRWPGEITRILESKQRAVLLSYPYTDWNAYVSAWRNDVAACLAVSRRYSAYHKQKPLIGFIGQGFIGKNYADDFERRGFTVVRYSLEEPYRANKANIAGCDIVFIAVPTPTTPHGFDVSILKDAFSSVGEGKVAVIKSTIVPGTTVQLQKEFPKLTIVYSPEFLSEATASWDAAHPFSNIVGISKESPAHVLAAEAVLSILPEAGFAQICSSTEAEIVKYSHNASAYTQVILFNVMYDLAKAHGFDWNNVREAVEADPFISSRYARPIHKTGRGAGGHCFIKDLAALRAEYERILPQDAKGSAFLRSLEQKNIQLLTESNKDLDLLHGVYGDDIRVA
jgi:hypothetical protein